MLLLSCIALAASVRADEHSHKVTSCAIALQNACLTPTAQLGLDGCGVHMQYKDGEPVRLWVNKVGPYDNPQETYNYYYLPFCAPRDAGKPKHKWGGLGEVLQGNELIDSQLEVKFKSKLTSLFTVCGVATAAVILRAVP